MNFLRNLKMGQRIQLFVFLTVVATYTITGIVLSRFSVINAENTSRNQVSVYINTLQSIVDLQERITKNGIDQTDITALKTHFYKAAFHKTDFPFILSNTGRYLLHITKEDQRIPKDIFVQIASNPNRQGWITVETTQGTEEVYYKYISEYDIYLGITTPYKEIVKDVKQNRFLMILVVTLAIGLFFITVLLIIKPITKTIQQVNDTIKMMALGLEGHKLNREQNDELGQITESLNTLTEGLSRTSHFANELGNNNLNAEFQPLSNEDILGNALISMRNSLKAAEIEEKRRKQEDETRNWITSGLAMFGDILRQNNNNLALLADSVTQNLVNYLNANQGGLFIYNNDDTSNPHLELVSAFAYNRKKFFERTIALNEGLVGTCAVEKNTIYLKEIPDGYITITSGLGEATPTSLLIVPLKLEDTIFGVVEIASFAEFSQHEIEFVEKIGESIASTLFSVKNAIRTTHLLEQSQQQREEMAAQEEEMRQNMEEMQATQEEMARKTIEMEGISKAIDQALIYCELDEDANIFLPNDNLAAAMGYPKHELDGVNLSEIVHISNKKEIAAIRNEIALGAPYKGTLHLINRDGQDLYLHTNISPTFDELGGIYKIILIGQDITESKLLEIKAQKQADEIEANLVEIKAEQQLAQMKENDIKGLLQALDTTCLITEIELSGKITYINNKNVETLGDPKDKIEGKYHRDLDGLAKKSPKEYEAFWNSLLSGISQNRVFSLTVNGIEKWISEHYTPVTDDNGNVTKVINIGFDITDSKEKEKEMQRLIAEIEQLKKNNNK